MPIGIFTIESELGLVVQVEGLINQMEDLEKQYEEIEGEMHYSECWKALKQVLKCSRQANASEQEDWVNDVGENDN